MTQAGHYGDNQHCGWYSNSLHTNDNWYRYTLVSSAGSTTVYYDTTSQCSGTWADNSGDSGTMLDGKLNVLGLGSERITGLIDDFAVWQRA